MATSPDAVRGQLAVVTATVAAEVSAAAAQAPQRPVEAALDAVSLVVPAFYDAAGSLAVSWYDEIRAEARPTTVYTPTIIGDPATDWIEREVAKFARQMEGDLETLSRQMVDEAARLAEKEAARGFRDTVTGNTRMDEDAIGWSRVARPGACKFCVMVASRGAVFRRETADFAAHKSCNCASRPEFRNGEHGPEASVEQYLAVQSTRTPAQREQLRKYLNEHFPDAPG